MKLTLVAVGRLKDGPERDLAERYRGRTDGLVRPLGFGALALHEIPESRARGAAERSAEEGRAILSRGAGNRFLVFDERASAVTSEDFAARLGRMRDDGAAGAVFVIGGADGLDPALRTRADLLVSFGRLTLPHQLVRVLVLEQIYRALTIMAGHPYHRGDPGGADAGGADAGRADLGERHLGRSAPS